MGQRQPFPWASVLIVLGGLLLGLAAGLIVFYSAPASMAAPGAVSPPAVPSAAMRAGTTAQPAATLPLPAPAPVVGAPAPDFELEDVSGNRISLAGYHGKVVLLNFWATWCPPCRQEMPTLQQQYANYEPQGLVVIGVESGEPKTEVRDFVAEQGLTFPILPDVKTVVTELYRVNALPTTFVINRQGVIVRQHRGMMTEMQIDNYLSELGFEKP